MSPVVWEPDARSEFLDGLARSPDPAAFTRDVDGTVADLASGLLTGSRVSRTVCREFVMTRLPYYIVYLDDPTVLQIVAFAHRSRRRSYWKSRLRRP